MNKCWKEAWKMENRLQDGEYCKFRSCPVAHQKAWCAPVYLSMCLCICEPVCLCVCIFWLNYYENPTDLAHLDVVHRKPQTRLLSWRHCRELPDKNWSNCGARQEPHVGRCWEKHHLWRQFSYDNGPAPTRTESGSLQQRTCGQQCQLLSVRGRLGAVVLHETLNRTHSHGRELSEHVGELLCWENYSKSSLRSTCFNFISVTSRSLA